MARKSVKKYSDTVMAIVSLNYCSNTLKCNNGGWGQQQEGLEEYHNTVEVN